MSIRFSRTGPAWGPVLFLCVAQTLLSAPAPHFSILGIRIGSDIDEVREKLDPMAVPNTSKREDEAGEGRKEAWILRRTVYKSIALQANAEGKVVWVTGFLRPGREIPFAQLGSASQAIRYSDTEAIWNVKAKSGPYRLVAKGRDRKASVLYLLSLSTPAIE